MSDTTKKKQRSWGKLGSKRGVETIFRTRYRTQVDLTDVADSKANIIISINGILLSVLLAAVVPNLTQQPWMAIPTVTLALTTVATLVLAILAALPRITQHDISLDAVRENKANILFFGHFTQLDRSEYEEGMVDLLHDRDLLYRNMIRDMYATGHVLERKFRLLRYAYLAFLSGLIGNLFICLGAYLWLA